MNNQDMPVSPATIKERFAFAGRDSVVADVEYSGETKREKAFWLMFSSMLASPIYEGWDCYQISVAAIEATSAGFEALDTKD